MPDTYVYRNGAFINKRTGEPMVVPPRDGVCCPRVHSDIAEYRSPIDGTLIGSRSTRRYDLEKNGCIEMDPPKKHRGYRNARFAAKHGLKLREDVAATLPQK